MVKIKLIGWSNTRQKKKKHTSVPIFNIIRAIGIPRKNKTFWVLKIEMIFTLNFFRENLQNKILCRKPIKILKLATTRTFLTLKKGVGTFDVKKQSKNKKEL